MFSPLIVASIVIIIYLSRYLDIFRHTLAQKSACKISDIVEEETLARYTHTFAKENSHDTFAAEVIKKMSH